MRRTSADNISSIRGSGVEEGDIRIKYWVQATVRSNRNCPAVTLQWRVAFNPSRPPLSSLLRLLLTTHTGNKFQLLLSDNGIER